MKKTLVLLLSLSIVFISCNNDDDSVEYETANLTLNLTGLEDLGSDYRYEGWIIVEGAPITTGTFSVNSSGVLSRTSFELDAQTLAAATNFVLSIEPYPDSDPAPAATKIFIGEFNGNTASMTTETVATSFTSISGDYILAAPTGTGAENEMYSGIWFLDNSSGSAEQGLELPTLEDGWKYEGWVVIDGTPLSTGTFTSLNASDEMAPFSGTNPGPPFPGEDFLVNAPSGFTFPTDLRGMTAVISIEPYPDNNSESPFTLKPLAGTIPTDISGVATIGSNVSGSFPSGTVSR